MVVMTMLAVWLLLLTAPNTSIAQFLRSTLVERPAAWLSRFGHGHVALFILLLMICGIVIWAGGGDAVRMLGMGTPEIIVWATTFDVVTYFDVAVALAMAASANRVRMMASKPLSSIRRIGRLRIRGARARRRAVRPTAANDDDGDPDRLAA